MKKQQFPSRFLKNNASSEKDFDHAGQIVEQGSYIQGPVVDEADCQVSYKVKDQNNTEEVQLHFFPNGLIKSFSCSCLYSTHREGLCWHVLASMMDLNRYEADDLTGSLQATASKSHPSISHNRNHEAVELMLKNYQRENQQISGSFAKESINFEFHLHIAGSKKMSYFLLNMKMGLDYLYVVQDIEEVIHDLKRGQSIRLGKQFTYHPDQYRIKTEDQNMIDLISYILQLMQSSSPGRQQAKRNEIYIPPQMLKELMVQLQKLDGGFIYTDFEQADTPSYQGLYIHQEADRLPLSFQLMESDDGVYAFVSKQQTIKQVRLFPRAQLIFYEGGFYFLSQDESQAISYLKESFDMVNYEALIMDGEHFSLFASSVLPQIRSLINLEMEENIADRFQTPPLQSSLYIDARDKVLYIRAVFRYGEHSLYPFESQSVKIESQSTILVRDLLEEKQRLEWLADALSEFDYADGFAWTSNLQTASSFLFEQLERLSPYFSIFMTQAAQNLIYTPSQPPTMAVEINSSSRLLDISFELEDISESELSQLMESLLQNRQYYRLSDGRIINLKDQAFQQIKESAETLELDSQPIKKHMQASLFKALNLDENDTIHLGQKLKDMADHLTQVDQLSFQQPASLHAQLRPFQEAGFQWLKTLNYYGFGGILADDMGLGKTIQTIAYLCSKKEEGQGPFLIICPSSVLYNWQYEFKKFAPGVKTQLVAGNKDEREYILKDTSRPIDAYITSYPLILRDQDLYDAYQFSTMVLDEAQHVKNINAKTTQAVKNINRQQTLALSGTPIENNLSELYSLFSIVMPGLFSSSQHFKSLSTRQIAKKIRPFVLRRLKSEVLFELAEKTERVEWVELSASQKKLYQAQVKGLKDDIHHYLDQGEWHQKKMNVLSSMTRLRQICNDPRLIDKNYKGPSTKLDRLAELLVKGRENGKRLVLFSQFTKMLELIKKLLKELGIDYHYLDGQTPAKERLDLCQRFNMGEKDLFLISLKAGGTGLNLTGGDTVILFDSWWNPAIEDQAADRVHRFGQKKAVQVIRMVTKGTIEEGIYELQNEKRELLEDMIESGSIMLSQLTAEDILDLIHS